MNESLPTVTVVIPTKGGRAEIIGRTIPVLLADPATNEVVVACDGDDPETNALTDSYAVSDDRVRRTTTRHSTLHNRGQSARDAGVRASSSELVLALDDDVEPEPSLVSGHARRHLGTGSDSVVVGYMPVVPPSRSDRSGPAHLYAETYERACAAFRANHHSVLMGLWGGNFSLSRERWLEVARKKPAVDAGYHVDREFGLRLRDAGIQGVFDPDLRAIHRFTRTPEEMLRDAESSGRAQGRLHAAYPDLVPPPQAPDEARASARPFIWLSRSRLGWHATTGVLLAVARVLEAIGPRTADYAVTRLLWRLGFARGLRAAN